MPIVSRRIGYFNPRPREGGDFAGDIAALVVARISIHAPARGATRMYAAIRAARQISIHAPARGATGAIYHHIIINTFQSTPPRGGRPSMGNTPNNGPQISIHAPARGATQLGRFSSQSILISIHAPARGATSEAERVDATLDISIHAPARGAT